MHHINRNLALFYLLTFFVGFLLISIHSFFASAWEGIPISLAFFLVSAAWAFARPVGALYALSALAGVSAGLHVQIESLFGVKTAALPFPGLDLMLGYSFGIVLRDSWWRRIVVWHVPAIICLVHFYLLCSVMLAISRNLHQSASRFVGSGFFSNLLQARTLGWHFDYFPLRDLYAYTVGLFFVVVLINVLKEHKVKFSRTVIASILASSGFVAAFAVAQYCFDVGYNRLSPLLGVNSFWPDIHAFATMMAVAIFMTIEFLLNKEVRQKRFLYALLPLLGMALLLSGSRFTILCVATVVTVRFSWAFRRNVRKLIVLYAVCIASVVLFFSVLAPNFLPARLQFSSLWGKLQNLSFSFPTINDMLSQRPGIYWEALRYFLEFPLIGLGQGEFYRTGALRNYSQSVFLYKSGGENAHNYFLQTLVELGLFGFILMVFLFLPLFQRSKSEDSPTRFIYLIGVCGVFTGNIFAHSLLVRDSFLLMGILLAPFYLEAAKDFIKPVWVMVFASLIVVAHFSAYFVDKPPFTYGIKCHESRKITGDGWVSGVYTRPLSRGSNAVSIVIDAKRPDIREHPFTLEVFLDFSDGRAELLDQRLVNSNGNQTFFVDWTGRNLAGVRGLRLKASNCYVPRNVSKKRDSRHLAYKLKELVFESKKAI